MKIFYCPITHEEINKDQRYSKRGLKLLSPQLKDLKPLNFTAEEQRKEALTRINKMSIQGIQLKCSARLSIQENCFKLVDQNGRYILKPQNEYYPELPQNEAISMSLAEKIGIETPIHGLVYSKDNSFTYFIKRFDRIGHRQKVATEDFAQLAELSRQTKYESSMEKIVKIIKKYCSFPRLDLEKLFRLTLFNFLIGNEDMHLKNFSVITRHQITTLSPAYDLLNTTIAQPHSKEEIALPLNGKKNNLTKTDFLKYFAVQQLELNVNVINQIIEEFKNILPDWEILISRSFLSKEMQNKYLDLLKERSHRLF